MYGVNHVWIPVARRCILGVLGVFSPGCLGRRWTKETWTCAASRKATGQLPCILRGSLHGHPSANSSVSSFAIFADFQQANNTRETHLRLRWLFFQVMHFLKVFQSRFLLRGSEITRYQLESQLDLYLKKAFPPQHYLPFPLL